MAISEKRHMHLKVYMEGLVMESEIQKALDFSELSPTFNLPVW